LREPRPSNAPPIALRAFVLLASFAIALALLYWLRPVLVPLALAILLTFVLSPLVTLVQRRAVPRVVAVMAAVGLAFALIVGLGSMVAREMNSLVDRAPTSTTGADRRAEGRRHGVVTRPAGAEEDPPPDGGARPARKAPQPRPG
jgi:predicted PurR-regulated permease PerM